MSEDRHVGVEILRSGVSRGHHLGLPLPCILLACRITPPRAGAPNPGLTDAEDALLAPMRADLGLRLAPPVARGGLVGAAAQRVISQLVSLNALILRLQLSCAWPVVGGGVIVRIAAASDLPDVDDAQCLWPCLDPVGFLEAIPWISARLRSHAVGDRAGEPPKPDLPSLLARLEAAAPAGVNTRLLVPAAAHRGIPILRLAGGVIQYGWGARSRWMQSSFTDLDSVISARLVRDKAAAHAVLSRAGLPVPRQARVGTLQDACAAAARFGYPVVIKPVDLDGGVGVACGLPDEAALRRAFVRASAHSARLVLETHVPGQDYRLGVVDGHVTWITCRTPAGVRGDGVTTLSQLIARANLDPRRSHQRRTRLRPLVVDAEAEELLVEQGFTLDDVPPVDVFVRLRRATNIGLGGQPLDVTGPVHPDNAALAERAATLFRLRVAGVDLITPDIARSWREAGGAICEVNGQPQIPETRPEVPALIFDRMVPADGRIPIVVLLAELRWDAGLAALHAQLAQGGRRVGFALADGVYVGGDRVIGARRSAFEDTQALLLDRSVDAIVVATDGKDWVRVGMPVDRVDLALHDDACDPVALHALALAGPDRIWRVGGSLATALDPHSGWVTKLAGVLSTAAVPERRLATR